MLNINTFLFIKITAAQDSKLWIQGKSKTAIQDATFRVAEFLTSRRCQFYAADWYNTQQSSHKHQAISDQYPYGDSQAWSEGRIGKVLSKAFQHVCGSTCGKILQLWGMQSMVIACLWQEILIKSDTCNQHQIYYS